jgi:hypothetical protein
MLTEYFFIGAFVGLLIDGFFFLSDRANRKSFARVIQR